MPFDGQLLEGRSPSFSCYWVDPRQRNKNFLGAYQFAHTPKFVPNAYLTLKICHYGVEMTHFTWNLTTPRERAWNFESTLKIWGLTSQAFSHNEILHFVSPEVWTELIRSLDDLRSYFLLSGSQDFADFEGKKNQFVQFTKMPISHEPFELHPWFFAGKQTLPREIRPKKLVFWRWVQPAQPAQPTYQMKKRKSGITFEWVSRFGWNFAWKLLKSIYITSMKKSLAEQIYTALPNQPKMVLIEIFWKFMKFQFFFMKHPHTIAFKHNLGKKYSHIDFLLQYA